MARIEVERLAFEFDEEWRIFKFDEHRDYRQGIAKLENSKAVDLLGIWGNSELFFVEVKDFRGYRIENKNRLSTGELAVELAQKVKDSLACIIGSFHMSSEPGFWQPFVHLLCSSNRLIRVALWVEEDFPAYPQLKQKAMASIRTQMFKQKLAWLTKRVLVCGREKHQLPNVSVFSLPWQ